MNSKNKKDKIDIEQTALIQLGIILVILIIFTTFIYNKFKTERQQIEDSYNKSLYDFVSNVSNIENELAKLRITSNDTYTLTTLASLFAKANAAKTDLESLPFEENSISNTSKFLIQLSDFSYSVMRHCINGEDISRFKDNIETLSENITKLSKVSEDIYHGLIENNIKWDELKREGNEKIQALNNNTQYNNNNDKEKSGESSNQLGIDSITKPFTDYDGIIYDGAFSNHVLEYSGKLLEEKEITENEAKEEINNYFGKDNISEINYINTIENRLVLYVYEVKFNGNETIKTIYITKNGGHVYQMVSDRKVNEKKISVDEAKKVGEEFLNKVNINNIIPTYYLVQDNMVTISYASIQDNVICYTDLVKVKIALDNGEIMTMEALGYMSNFKERNMDIKYSAKEARDTLYPDLQIENERLCYIPTESKDEVLCYEFKGKVNDKVFLVYVNASILNTEKIYILLETEGGTLAI